MKSTAILLLAFLLGCSPSGGADGSDEAPKIPHPPRYRLVGLPTGPRLFFDQARCLLYLKTYAAGMETGLGSGSSANLRCEPENASALSTSA